MIRLFRKGLLPLLFVSCCTVFAATNTVAPMQTQPPVPTPMPVPAAVPQATNTTPVPPTLNAKGYILVDADSGTILAQQNANVRMPPASLTKLMSMYVVSGAIASGKIHLTDMVPISENAWKTGGSRMFVKVGTQVAVQDLIQGIIVASGNDATVAMSEYVGGNQDSFVDMMNKMAAQLGMQNTHYIDVTGLPDPNHYSTPYDLSLLTRAIIHNYPQDYKFYSEKWITYNNIKQPNRNRLLWRDPSVDGLKTGHTDEAGFCLIASGVRNGTRLIAVVMGTPSDAARNDDAEALLNYGFRNFETHKLYAANVSLIEPRVWFGEQEKTSLGLAQDLLVTIPKGQYDKLTASMTLGQTLKAPIVKGQAYGSVAITLNGQIIATRPLVALTDDAEAGFFSRLIDHIRLLFSKSK